MTYFTGDKVYSSKSQVRYWLLNYNIVIKKLHLCALLYSDCYSLLDLKANPTRRSKKERS
jgi:hypothetical protein